MRNKETRPQQRGEQGAGRGQAKNRKYQDKRTKRPALSGSAAYGDRAAVIIGPSRAFS